MVFRITTWNVNGIRNPFGYQPWREKRTFKAMFDILEADIVIMQEAKIQRKDLQDDMVLVPGWDVYFSLPQHKKGYSGVAIYTKNATCAPIRAEEGILGVLCPPKSSTPYRDLPKDKQIGGYPTLSQLGGNIDEALLDSEGRCVILEFPAFVLLGVYSPANRDESRMEFRESFVEALDARIRNLVAMGKQVILTGDLNIIRSEMDCSNMLDTLQKEGMSVEEWQSMPTRRIFNQLLFEGTVIGERDKDREQPVLWDICRCFHPTRIGMHTCWDTKKNMRPANVGARIDYILCSDGIKDWFVDSNIQEGLMGSDHCPVYATMGDTVTRDGKEVPLAETMNPDGMFRDGRRVRSWEQRDALPLSAKLIPDFDRRQNIRDMFTRKASQATPSQAPTPTPTPKDAQKVPDIESAGVDKGTDNTAASSGTAATGAGGESALYFGSTKGLPPTPSPGPVAQEPVPLAKRSSEGLAEAAAPAAKKSKNSAESSKAKVANGQRTLQGFFKPKNTSTKQPPPASALAQPFSAGRSQMPSRATQTPATATAAASVLAANGGLSNPLAPSPATSTPQEMSPAKMPVSPGRVFDPIEAKESWSKLLGKRVVPKCEHDEPCISLVTKKPGMNCGRSFYICPRPLGPSGDKERDTEWRCGTFIWSSDWNSASSSGGS